MRIQQLHVGGNGGGERKGLELVKQFFPIACIRGTSGTSVGKRTALYRWFPRFDNPVHQRVLPFRRERWHTPKICLLVSLASILLPWIGGESWGLWFYHLLELNLSRPQKPPLALVERISLPDRSLLGFPLLFGFVSAFQKSLFSSGTSSIGLNHCLLPRRRRQTYWLSAPYGNNITIFTSLGRMVRRIFLFWTSYLLV
jgi:hypothetical protein